MRTDWTLKGDMATHFKLLEFTPLYISELHNVEGLSADRWRLISMMLVKFCGVIYRLPL